ncbi:MAG: M28 family peptidase [Myxococcales bacterium]
MPQTDTSRAILGWTQRIIDACGPRPAGSKACLDSAQLIAKDLEENCDRVELQEFACRPAAFMAFETLSAVLGATASALLFFGLTWPALALYWFVALLAITQFGFYFEIIDRFFPQKRCVNVVATLEPKGPVKRQVIISGHHDSAFEFRYLRISPLVYVGLGAWQQVAQYAMPLVLTALVAAAGLGAWAPGQALLRGLAVFAFVPAVIFTTYFTRRPVPGAGDNLVSSGMAVHAAKVFRQRLQVDPEALAGTRLLLVSFDAEESGLRGSRAFVQKNLAQLSSVPTVMLNLESFYKLKDLKVLTADLNGFRKLSRRVADLFIEEGKAEGFQVAPMKLFYGLGATDAAELAKVGVEAATLLAVPSSPIGAGKILYHTREDVPANLEPEVIDAAARITLRMVNRLGKEPVAKAETAAA